MPRRVHTWSELAALERHYRRVGFEHGYAGRAAVSPDSSYQYGWRRGREARQAEGLEPEPDGASSVSEKPEAGGA